MQGGGCYTKTGIIFVLKSGILCSSANFFCRHNNTSELMIKYRPVECCLVVWHVAKHSHRDRARVRRHYFFFLKILFHSETISVSKLKFLNRGMRAG